MEKLIKGKYFILILLNIYLVIFSACSPKGNLRTIKQDNILLEQNAQTKYNNFYILGDSLSDSGVFIGILNAVLKVVKQELPYIWINEIYFASPAYQGRSFSDGPMAVEYVASKLGLPVKPGWSFYITPALKHWIIERQAVRISIPANSLFQEHYLNNLSYTLNEQIGTNYAVANARASFGYSLPYFLLFNQFQLKNQVSALLKHHLDLSSKDLLFIMIGGNDIMAAIHEKQPIVIIEESIKEIVNTVNLLTTKNVEHIIVANVPDIGLIPEFINTDKQKIASQLSIIFNQKLKNSIQEFKKNIHKLILNYLI